MHTGKCVESSSELAHKSVDHKSKVSTPCVGIINLGSMLSNSWVSWLLYVLTWNLSACTLHEEVDQTYHGQLMH